MPASLTGDKASFSMSGTNPTITPGTTADFDRWTADGLGPGIDVTRPFNWLLDKVTMTPNRATGRLYGEIVTGQTPALGTIGTSALGVLKLYIDSANTLGYSFKAALFDLRMEPNSTQGGKQRFSYAFHSAGESSADTITVGTI